jgi:hypothetical protein
MAIHAVWAIIADSGRAIVVIYRAFILLILLKSFDGGLVQPLAKRLPGVRYFCPSNHAAGGENGCLPSGGFSFPRQNRFRC